MQDLQKLQDQVKRKLTPFRFTHSLGVAEVASRLAEKYGEDPDLAVVAALLHDLAKDLPLEQLVALADQHRLWTHQVERLVPDLLHGPVAACLIPEEFGITDSRVLRAVAVHTVGATEMSVLDKIIYLADMIEPQRLFPGVKELRQLAEEDLDTALLAGFDLTIRYCLKQTLLIHPQTIDARNQLLQTSKNCRQI